MLEPGTVGDAQVQMRRVLHIDDPAVFHPSMNALAQGLENALYLKASWLQPFAAAPTTPRP
jgi:hypothetical protein